MSFILNLFNELWPTFTCKKVVQEEEAWIVFWYSWSKSPPHPLGFCKQMLNMLWAKDWGFPAKQLQRHRQTTITKDISQKALGVQISLIKMGKATVSEVRGGCLRGEGGGKWREEREGEKVINILQVFSNTGRLTPSGKCHLMDYILGWKVRLIQCNERWMGLQALMQPQETPYKRVCSFSH